MPNSLLNVIADLPGRQRDVALSLLEQYPELTDRLEKILTERKEAVTKGNWAAVEDNVLVAHKLVSAMMDEAEFEGAI